jgi:hypothetical protein
MLVIKQTFKMISYMHVSMTGHFNDIQQRVHAPDGDFYKKQIQMWLLEKYRLFNPFQHVCA